MCGRMPARINSTAAKATITDHQSRDSFMGYVSASALV
jgi:hypothetical protein